MNSASIAQSKQSLRSLYKQLLRACETYPSKNRHNIYRAIQDEWREHISLSDTAKIQKQIAVAEKGLSQLQQFDERQMAGSSKIGGGGSADWSVTLEQNPMPKPPDYDERNEQQQRKDGARV